MTQLHLFYYLSKHPDMFVVSITSFMSSSVQHDVQHLQQIQTVKQIQTFDVLLKFHQKCCPGYLFRTGQVIYLYIVFQIGSKFQLFNGM